MAYIIVAIIILVVSGFSALFPGNNPRRSGSLAVSGNVLACVLGVIPASLSLFGGVTLSLRFRWDVPYGSFHVAIDPLSAFFIVPILFISAMAAIYGRGYMSSGYGDGAVRRSWFFYNILTASMLMVVLARNGVLFLVSWEIMTIASFFLVTLEDGKEETRAAGMIYITAMHFGTAFIMVLFLLLGKASGSLDFDGWSAGSSLPAVIFVLAVIGFGTKAGFMPFHVWLPEAHPAAPSHVSALMSAVMIKTGIYGLLRVLEFLGHPSAWWGYSLIGIGLFSGILGVTFAAAQHDIKRLLAYSSMENIGIITLGMGVGILGVSEGAPVLAVLGFGGALLHVVNHALFKGLLFLGAGAVVQATGTREIDRMGGVLKKMPRTGICFLVGSAAIAGLPPLNGFASEFMIFFGAFSGVLLGAGLAAASFGVIAALALIGGLAAACFTKAFGIMFLGTPRVSGAAPRHEAPAGMLLPMYVLAACCIVIGLAAPAAVFALKNPLSDITGLSGDTFRVVLIGAPGPLAGITAVSLVFLPILAGAALLRRNLLSGRDVRESATWGCGYAAYSPRMQYTASSFVRPLLDQFRFFLRTVSRVVLPKGIFPEKASIETETPDIFLERVYSPFFRWVSRTGSRLKWIQHGRVQFYVMYIALTLLVVLVLGLRKYR